MNKLYIDTRDNQRIVVRLEKNGHVFEEESIANKDRAQAALPLVEKVLSRAKMRSSHVNEINVETGPGSFTGLRVGIAIANALAFSSQVRINRKRLGGIETPQY